MALDPTLNGSPVILSAQGVMGNLLTMKIYKPYCLLPFWKRMPL
jgi:hypothetical protein